MTIKLFFKILIQTCKFLLIVFPLQLLGGILVGLYFLQYPEIKKLPFLLRWFDGADQYFGRDTTTYNLMMQGSAWQKYCWLCWRNPLNYFGYKYLGVTLSDRVQIVLDSRIANVPDKQIGDGINKCPGTYYCEIADTNSDYFEYYKIFKYSSSGTTKCCRIRIGWKIGQDRPIPLGQCQWVFVISPLHSYDGV